MKKVYELGNLQAKNKLINNSLLMLKCIEEKDVEGLLLFLDEGVIWTNMPFPKIFAVKGKNGVRRQLKYLLKMFSGFKVGEITNIVENDGVVMMERTEILTAFGLNLRVEGISVLVFENGKVVEWRDYFDNMFLALNFILSLPKQFLAKII